MFTDFFGELAQVLHEAALVRGGDEYEPFAHRAAACRRAATAVLAPLGSVRFPEAQQAASAWLRDLRDEIRDVAARSGAPFTGEQLAVGVWVADHEGGEVTLVASSDRAMTDRASLQPIPMDLVSPWASIEAVTRASSVDRDPDVYATRWRYVRALPIVSSAGGVGRVVAGAVTLTSTEPLQRSAFARLPVEAQRRIDTLAMEEVAAIFA